MSLATEPPAQSFTVEVNDEILAVVIRLPDVVIGHVDNRAADIRVRGPLQFRHARLSRHERSHLLTPFWTTDRQPYPVQVDGRPLGLAGLFLGPDQVELCLTAPTCRWTYARPVTKSDTAVLSVAEGCESTIILPDGRKTRRIILMGDQCVLTAPNGHGHLAVPHLPAAVTLQKSNSGMTAQSNEADVIVGATCLLQEFGSNTALPIPSKVEVIPRMRTIIERMFLARQQNSEPIIINLRTFPIQ